MWKIVEHACGSSADVSVDTVGHTHVISIRGRPGTQTCEGGGRSRVRSSRMGVTCSAT